MSDEKTPASHPMPKVPIPRGAIWAVVGLSFVAVVLLFYMIEGWRGQKAWRDYAVAEKAKGIELSWDAFIPAPVPEDQNFAMTPLLKPLLDFVPGTQITKIENPFAQLDRELNSANELSKEMGFNFRYDYNGRKIMPWEKGETLDLLALLGTNNSKSRLEPGNTNTEVMAGLPDSREKAAAIIRDIQSQTIDPMLDELFAASQRTYCRFPVKYDNVPMAGILLPHLNAVKNLIAHISWRAEARLALGEGGKAFDDLKLGFYMSDSLRGEPVVFSEYVRFSCRQILTQVVFDGLSAHRWSDGQLHMLIDGLSKDDFIKDSQHVISGARAGSIRTIEQVRKTEAGFSVDDILSENGTFRSGQFKPIQFLFPDGWLHFEQVNTSRFFDRYLDPLADWQLGKRDAAALFKEMDKVDDQSDHQAAFSNSLFKHELFAKLFRPAAGRFLKKAFHAQTITDLTFVSCALERVFLAEGDYPENPQALVPKFLDRLPNDPMSGKPFLYRKDRPKHFILYSIGSNFIDDGGKVGLDKKGNVTVDEGDWVWKM